MKLFILLFLLTTATLIGVEKGNTGDGIRLTKSQVTKGTAHHLFGYIGQSLTIPWNAGDRYIVALQTDFHDRLPGPDDAAEIVLIDTHDDNALVVLDRTFGWNLQQGTML